MTKPTPEPAIALDRKQVARLLGVSISGVRNLERRGVLHPFKLGGLVRHRRADVEAAIATLADQARSASPAVA
jgi:hypothetical protein